MVLFAGAFLFARPVPLLTAGSLNSKIRKRRTKPWRPVTVMMRQCCATAAPVWPWF